MSKLKIEYIAISALRPYPRNARTHSRKQTRQIANSIRAFGFPSRFSSTTTIRFLPAMAGSMPRG